MTRQQQPNAFDALVATARRLRLPAVITLGALLAGKIHDPAIPDSLMLRVLSAHSFTCRTQILEDRKFNFWQHCLEIEIARRTNRTGNRPPENFSPSQLSVPVWLSPNHWGHACCYLSCRQRLLEADVFAALRRRMQNLVA